MKTDRLTRLVKGFTGSIGALFGRRPSTRVSNPAKFRLDFIAENTFNRVWSLRFGRVRVIVGSIIFVAAIATLVYFVVFFTPIRHLMPGRLEGSLRSDYVDMVLKLDSLEDRARVNDRFITNIRQIMLSDSAAVSAVDPSAGRIIIEPSDSLLSASEAEQRFVQTFEGTERYNLSVLTPIAAEAMAFYSPVPDAVSSGIMSHDSKAVIFDEPALLSVSAAYRGTVIGAYTANDGLVTVVVQHPNDFVSVYTGLSDCFVISGAKVVAGERIGHSGRGKRFVFELWHNGSATTPTDYIGF